MDSEEDITLPLDKGKLKSEKKEESKKRKSTDKDIKEEKKSKKENEKEKKNKNKNKNIKEENTKEDRSDKKKEVQEISGSDSDSDEVMGEDVYIVEAIVGRRKVKGKVQYHLKWKGYEELTWEEEENVFCKDLIADYESKHPDKRKRGKDKLKESKEKSNENSKESSKKSLKEEDKSNKKQKSNQSSSSSASEGENTREIKVGFEYGNIVDEILGARMLDGQLNLYCSWEGTDQTTFVPAKLLNIKVPHAVIRFYESRLRFEEPDDRNSPQRKGHHHGKHMNGNVTVHNSNYRNTSGSELIKKDVNANGTLFKDSEKDEIQSPTKNNSSEKSIEKEKEKENEDENEDDNIEEVEVELENENEIRKNDDDEDENNGNNSPDLSKNSYGKY